MNSLQEIKKPWAVYHYGVPCGIGRIISETPQILTIRDSEKQTYPLQLWNPKAVRRFSTSPEAVEYFLNHSSQYTREKLLKKLETDFPVALKQECRQTLPKRTSQFQDKSKAKGPVTLEDVRNVD